MAHNSEQDVTWFPSKVDLWLGAIVAGVPVIGLLVLGVSIASGERSAIVVAIVTLVFIVGLYAVVMFPTRYGITREELIIQFGLLRHRIRLETIKEVRPTRNPISAPALSLDRLSIRTTGRSFYEALISPADQETFCALLSTRAGLRRDGDRLVRD